jgi:hypothetical protein
VVKRKILYVLGFAWRIRGIILNLIGYCQKMFVFPKSELWLKYLFLSVRSKFCQQSTYFDLPFCPKDTISYSRRPEIPKLSFRHIDDTSILIQIQTYKSSTKLHPIVLLNLLKGSKLSLVHPSSLLTTSRLVSSADFRGSKSLAPFSGA